MNKVVDNLPKARTVLAFGDVWYNAVMQRKFVFSEGEFYHIYSRGVNKSDVFLSDQDRNRFTNLLFLCNSQKSVVFEDIKRVTQGRSLPIYNFDRGDSIVDIVAYCLMPNHFHLLLYEKKSNGISIFMKKLLTAYSSYFNKINERTGPLFEGRFKARHADKDEYLKYLFSYIHLNPVKLVESGWKEEGIKDKDRAQRFLEEYRYSSYPEYAQGLARPERLILNKEVAPEYFESGVDFDDFISEWLDLAEFRD